jgi:hypothetical protein
MGLKSLSDRPDLGDTVALGLFDLRFHVRQAFGQAGIGIEVEHRKYGAGTCETTNCSTPRETAGGGLDRGGGGTRRAGARTSQAEIRLVWRQKRHKTDPEYSPENHVMPFCVPRTQHDARPVPARLVACLKLKPVARFAIQRKRKADRIVSMQFKF